MNLRHWHRFSQGQFGLMLIFIVFGLPGFLFLFNEVTFGVILLALTVGMAFLWLQKSGMDMGTYRIVAHDPELTLQVLEKVLNEKGLLFTSRGRTLSLTDNVLQIRVRPASNRSVSPGTQIFIEPENDKTTPLIASLCQKIDEAFLPRGL